VWFPLGIPVPNLYLIALRNVIPMEKDMAIAIVVALVAGMLLGLLIGWALWHGVAAGTCPVPATSAP